MSEVKWNEEKIRQIKEMRKKGITCKEIGENLASLNKELTP
jgi:DNA-binding transcriptional MerR regulator